MDTIRVLLFGLPQVERNGKVITIPRKKGMALLAYLLVSPRFHSRGTLAAFLWPGYDTASARGSLRREISRLKSLIGSDFLVIEREQVGLAPGTSYWLDVDEFQQLLEQVRAHGHPSGELCETCQAALNRAVDLYRDDFLAGFSLPDSVEFEDWQFFQAESLKRDYAGALQLLIAWHSSLSEYEVAIDFARRWLALDQLNEEAHRWLMKLYSWSGNHVAALRQYRDCELLLKRELGISPDEETLELYNAIKNRSLAKPPTQERAGAMPAPIQPEQRYVQEKLLDSGGQGEVYLGRDRITGQQVVIKRLKPELVAHEFSIVDRLKNEGEALRKLDHPNIVKFIDAFEAEGRYHLVMEYVPGGSLRKLLNQQPQLPLDRVLAIGVELADAMSRTHHLNIIHRDLKPENVLLSEDGSPRLMDFGVARLLQAGLHLTQTGALVGSPAYMSPEAVRGEVIDARSDIWSFGVLLFEMLTGQLPFQGEQLTPVLLSILNDPLPEISRLRPDAPQALIDLIRRMTEKERAARIPSMRQVAAALDLIRMGLETGQIEVKVDTPAAAGTFVERSRSTTKTPFPILDWEADPRTPRFVSRETELLQLDRYLNMALEGRGQVVFVTGEPGQGKTMLLREFSRRAQAVHPRLVAAGGTCNAYSGVGDPYLPFRQILELLTGNLESRPLIGAVSHHEVHRLRSVFPIALRALLETAPELLDIFVSSQSLARRVDAILPAHEGWAMQFREWIEKRGQLFAEQNLQQTALFEQYTRMIHQLAHQVPLLLVLDDLQWADQGSINLLFSLGKRLTNHQILIVCAYRSNEVVTGQDTRPHPLLPVVQELQRAYGQLIVDLDQAQGLDFVNELLDTEPNLLDANFRQVLYKQTGGHPLFTIELLRGMVDRGDLYQDEQGRWVAGPSLDWETLPARVEGAIGERITRLPAQLQQLLQTASVEGEEFTAEVVATVLGLPDREVVRHLSGDLDKTHHLVGVLGTRRAGDRRMSRYRFRHNLIQRYLYQRLDEVERAYQHEAVGNALEALFKEESGQVAVHLAWHFEAAGMPQRAYQYLCAAGDKSRRSAAYAEAIHLYKAALRVWPDVDRGEKARLLRKLGICEWVYGNLQDALGAFEAACPLFEEVGDRIAMGDVQRLIGRIFWEMGNRKESLRHYHLGLQILQREPESVELAWAISSISQMHMLAAEHAEAIAWGERAVALAERLQAEPVIIHALTNIGTAYMNTGNVARGQPLLEESIRRAVEINFTFDACRAYVNLGEGLSGLGYYEAARKVLKELHERAIQWQVRLFAGSSIVELMRVDWYTGRWREALQHREEFLQWKETLETSAYVETIWRAVLGFQENDLGRFEKALQALEPGLEALRSFDEIQLQAPFLQQLGRAYMGLGRVEDAAHVVQELVDDLNQAPPHADIFTSLPLLYLVYWFLGSDLPDAVEQAQAMIRKLDQAYEQIKTELILAAALEAKGKLCLHVNDPPSAAEKLQQAADLWRKLTRPFDQARCLYTLSLALESQGKTAEAAGAIEAASRLIGGLADELDDPELRASFLNTPFTRQILAQP